MSFDDAPKGAGPRFSGDERASVLLSALAVDAGLDPRILTHLAIEEDQIDALLVERGVFGEME